MGTKIADIQGVFDDTTGLLIGFKMADVPGGFVDLAEWQRAQMASNIVTCAWLVANAGSYHRQRKYISDAGGNVMPCVEWDANDNCWYPENGLSLMHSTAPQTVSAAVNHSLNLLFPGTNNDLALPAGLLVLRAAAPSLGLSIEQHCEVDTAVTAITHTCTLNDGGGAASVVNWTGTTSRLLDRSFAFRNVGAANVQRVNIKSDNNDYFPEGNKNSNVTALTKNTALACTLSNRVAYTNTSATALILGCNVWLSRGHNG